MRRVSQIAASRSAATSFGVCRTSSLLSAGDGKVEAIRAASAERTHPSPGHLGRHRSRPARRASHRISRKLNRRTSCRRPVPSRTSARASGWTTSPVPCWTRGRSSTTSTTSMSPVSRPIRRIYDRAIGGSTAYDDQIAAATRAGRPARTRSSSSRSRTSGGRPTSSGRSTTGPGASTDSCRSRCRRSSPTTRRRQPPRRSGSRGWRTGRTCSSRSRARRRACPPSSGPSPRRSRSNVTLLFSPAQYSPPRTPIPAVSSDGSRGLDAAVAVSGLVVRQPLGRRSPPASSPRPAGGIGIAVGPAGLPRLAGVLRLGSLAAAARRGARPAASAVREHRDQGSEWPGPPSTSPGWRRGTP